MMIVTSETLAVSWFENSPELRLHEWSDERGILGPVLDTRAVPPLANHVNGGEAYEEALDWLSTVETGEPLYPNGWLPR
jgi:hypothetical protein